jgi:hypothetical protein
MRRCLKGLGGFPTSTDGFILGPSHGTVGRLAFLLSAERSRAGNAEHHAFSYVKLSAVARAKRSAAQSKHPYRSLSTQPFLLD